MSYLGVLKGIGYLGPGGPGGPGGIRLDDIKFLKPPRLFFRDLSSGFPQIMKKENNFVKKSITITIQISMF